MKKTRENTKIRQRKRGNDLSPQQAIKQITTNKNTGFNVVRSKLGPTPMETRGEIFIKTEKKQELQESSSQLWNPWFLLDLFNLPSKATPGPQGVFIEP